MLQENPHKTTKKIAQLKNISNNAKFKRKVKFHLYKLNLIHELI